jgi:hypothetical protein
MRNPTRTRRPRWRQTALGVAALGLAVGLATSAAPTASATPGWLPRAIDATTWSADGITLRVYPSEFLRVMAQSKGTTQWMMYRAWAWDEVMAKTPGSRENTTSMRDQFFCHYDFVSTRAPNKQSWNLDSNRQDVSYTDMVRSQCNPPAKPGILKHQILPQPPPPPPAPANPSFRVYANPNLALRSDAYLTSPVLTRVPRDTWLTFQCYKYGSSVDGNTIWGRTTYAGVTGFVSDRWIDLGGGHLPARGVPPC